MKKLIIVRGGGDIATGTIYKLKRCGFPVLILETEQPSAIRRHVSFCEAVYTGRQQVEDMTATLAHSVEEAVALLEEGQLPLLVDPKGDSIEKLKPLAVVDAILAKRNLGTHRDMAPVVIGLGPGFSAGEGGDVHAVIETMRGHDLGRIFYEGSALPNTGVPGDVGGYTKERVIHSPVSGFVRPLKEIGDPVSKGEIIAHIDSENSSVPVAATMDGLLRGMIREGFALKAGFKMADIDPRLSEYKNCFTISDKARCIGGAVVEAIFHLGGAILW